MARLFAVAFIFALSVFTLTGCDEEICISLNCESVFMTVGESRDLLPYVSFSDFNADKDITVFSNDEDIASVSGNRLTARKKGETTVDIYAYDNCVTLSVSVGYMQSSSLSVEVTDQYQTVDPLTEKPKPVTFRAYVDGPDPDTVIEWTVDDKAAGSGETFEFTPKGYGEYTVEASADGITESKRVAMYYPSFVDAAVSGVLSQTDGNFSPVIFTAREFVAPSNYPSVYEWMVNGEVCGDKRIFSFTPENAGEYEVTLKVNGLSRNFGKEKSVKITASGGRAPTGEVVFDEEDSVYLKWRDNGYIVRASVFCPDGSRVNIDRSDAQNSYRFEKGALNLDGIIEVCAAEPSSYRIEIVADGKTEVKFTQYPAIAQKFLDETVLAHNGFISDTADLERWVREVYACGSKHAECYLSRGVIGSELTVKNQAAALGLTVVTRLDGSKLIVDFGDYHNAPNTTEKSSEIYQLYYELPHLEYDKAYLRGKSFIMPIDRRRGGVEVKTSEQLLAVALDGGRPLPTENSTAEIINKAVRNVLLGIVAHDYTQAQTVHTIYDWLQWTTVHSYSTDKGSSSRFLEGAFGSAELTVIVSDRPALTSEGMAKAFAFMCRMEGIECDILYTYKNKTPYYCNALNLDGAWYYVDVFGGEVESDELGIKRSGEYTSHRGLFMPVNYAEDLGIDVELTPLDAYDEGLLVYIEKKTDGDFVYDKFIEYEDIERGEIKAAVIDAFSSIPKTEFSVITVGSIITNTVMTHGVELMIDWYLDIVYDDELRGEIEKELQKAVDEFAIKTYGKRFPTVSVYLVGNVLYVGATVMRTTFTGR